MADEKNLPKVLSEIAGEAVGLLSRPIAEPDRQLFLFEEFYDYNTEQKIAKNPKNQCGLTWAQEVFAQLVARGYSKLEAYRNAYPNSTTLNLNTVYPKASRLAKLGKVGARIDTITQQLAARALMSETEFFTRLTAFARNGGKDGLDALVKVGQIHGVFKAEKDLPGSLGNPVVIQTIDYASVKIAAQQASAVPSGHEAGNVTLDRAESKAGENGQRMTDGRDEGAV